MKKTLYFIFLIFCGLFSFENVNYSMIYASSVSSEMSFNRDIKKVTVTESMISTYDLASNPNDGNRSFSDAKQIRFGNNSGTFDSELDPDYYYFICFNSGKYNIDSSVIKSDISIYKNNELSSPVFTYCGEDNPNGIDVDLTSGNTYYFCITPCEFSKGSYSININFASNELSNAEVYTLSYNSYYGYSIKTSVSTRKVYYYLDSSLNNKYSLMNDTLKRNFINAALIWNKLGCIQFVETNSSKSANITISATNTDKLNKDNKYSYGETSFKHKTFNSKAIKSSSIVLYCGKNAFNNGTVDDEAATMICVHELGHAIGLDHSPYYEKNVMYFEAEHMSRDFGINDIATYNYLWRN